MSESCDKVENVSVAPADDKIDSETSSVKSESSGVIRKPTGLKPPSSKIAVPSKIGRLCTGQQKKPNLPAAGSLDESETMMRGDEDRHKLSAGSSMDTLWELHPRRLSEAGLCRHSDTSLVLTEDTDSFIIGDRVWVGGTKPGQIAYIGETQFAPGDWAGIALDQPIGKNDGSVGGIRYFQCEPKRGVFSRLTRLTRVPLANATDGGGDAAMINASNGSLRNASVSPTGSSRSLMRSTGLSTSNTSIASSVAINYKMGDRVIIQSTQGSKLGTVRYIGTTQFAPGEWCGVELDEPRGKNDGAVGGIRYFECRPNFGLFAPVSKVSRSPSKHKPGTCVVHPGVPPSGFRRAGSKESLNSSLSLTSAASSSARRVRLGVNSLSPTKKVATKTSTQTTLTNRTALQDVLREKQQHIEQLLKERDLERAEITRAASQADEAEQKLAELKLEYEQHKEECQMRFREQMTLLKQMQSDRVEVESQFEDEKRKHEDTQFKYEEASIAKSDLEALQQENKTRLVELEQLLNAERERAGRLEGDAGKRNEFEDAYAKVLSEMDALKEEFSLQTRSIAEQLDATRKDLDESRFQLDEERRMKENIVVELRKEIDGLSKENETARAQHAKELAQVATRIEDSQVRCAAQEFEIKTLKENLERAQQSLSERERQVEEIATKSIADKAEMEKELVRLKQEISAKVLDNESVAEKLRAKSEEFASVKTAYGNAKSAQETATTNCERLTNEFKAREASYAREIDELKRTLATTLSETDAARERHATETKANETRVEELTNVNAKQREEIERLTSDLNALRAQHDENLTTVGEKHKRDVDEHVGKMNAMAENLQAAEKTIVALRSELETKTHELDAIRLEMESNARRLEQEMRAEEALNEANGRLKLNVSELSTQLERCTTTIGALEDENGKLRAEVQELVKAHDVGDKLEVLHVELTEKAKQLEAVKSEYERKLAEKDQRFHQMTIEMEKSAQDAEQKRREHEEKINLYAQQETNLRQKYEQLQAEHKATAEQLHDRLQQMARVVQEKDAAFESALAANASNEESFRTRLQAFESDANQLRPQIVALTSELAKSNELVQRKSDEIEALKKHVGSLESSGSVAETKHSQRVIALEDDVKQKTSIIEDLQRHVTSLEEAHSTCGVTFSSKDDEIAALQAKCASLSTACNEQETSIKSQHEETVRALTSELERRVAEAQQLKTEVDALRRNCEKVSADVVGKEQEVGQFRQMLTEKETTITNIGREKEQLSQTYADLTSKFACNVNELNAMFARVAELTAKAAEAEKCARELEIEKNNYAELVKRVRLTAKQKASLLAAIDAMKGASNCTDLVKITETIGVEVADGEKEMRAAELQKERDNARATLEESERTVGKLREEVQSLQNELLQTQDALKQTINNNVKDDNRTSQINNNVLSDDEHKKLLEEKKFAEMQVNFLNSIIADMKKKNDEQKARIEILESGYSPADANDMQMYGMPSKQIAPRAYCDICEEFDLHETENCPKQGDDDMPAVKTTNKRSIPPERPYCEFCEIFGHETQDCQDDQTF